jgi:protein TonB
MSGPNRPYRSPPSALRPALLTIPLAVALAAATLGVLPLFGLLSAKRHERTTLREAPRIVQAPPPVERPLPPTEASEPRSERPRPAPARAPRLERRERRVQPLPAALAVLETTLDVDVGEVAIDFEVERPEPGPSAGPRPSVGGGIRPRPFDEPPRAVLVMKPAYPYAARRRGVEGMVELLLHVDASGRVQSVRVLRAEPPGVFDEAARRAAGRWRYRPATKAGRPVAARIRQTVRFELEDER